MNSWARRARGPRAARSRTGHHYPCNPCSWAHGPTSPVPPHHPTHPAHPDHPRPPTRTPHSHSATAPHSSPPPPPPPHTPHQPVRTPPTRARSWSSRTEIPTAASLLSGPIPALMLCLRGSRRSPTRLCTIWMESQPINNWHTSNDISLWDTSIPLSLSTAR